MRGIGIPSWLLTLSMFCLLQTTTGVLDHHLDATHLMGWKTLPTGKRVSSPEKMHRHFMQTWKRRTSERIAHQWLATAMCMASESHGRKLSVSRSLATAAEVKALLAFRSAISRDPIGALTNWTSENEASHCSTWNGITCDDHGRVTGIQLGEFRFNGTISPSVGDLAHLQTLNLTGSSLWGTIPSSLGRCQNLTVLDLSENSLDGPVPAELLNKLPRLELLWLSNNALSGRLPEVVEAGGCRSLKTLWIDNCLISGTLPSSLWKCQNLQILSLSQNSVSGSIPAALSELHQLQELWLDNNNLSGHILSELGLLTKLQWLILEANNLDGDIPPSLGALGNLLTLDLKSNNLTGPIPPTLGNCTSLVNLMLGPNKLNGTIPEELGELRNIQGFDFQGNGHLTGPVPGFLSKCSKLQNLILDDCGFSSIAREIWSLPALGQLAVSGNRLTEELPLEVGNCTSLTWLDLGWNELLTGSLPPTLGLLANLSTLSLTMNRFTGEIPPELGNLKQLVTLQLGKNHGLEGPIPRELSSLTTLVNVDLGSCSFSGPIPEDLFTNNLYISNLRLNNNMLTGSLPATVGKLQFMETLYLQNNKLSGGIPAEIGDCSSLTDLVLSNNQFSGTVPASIGKLSYLEATLDLSQNYLTGELPRGLGKLTKLRRLILATNGLNGTIPEDLGGCAALTRFDLSNNFFTGRIPNFLGNFHGLVTLDLSNNTLTDDAAALSSLNWSRNLETLTVGQNNLFGTLPVDFTTWPSLKYFNVSGNELTGEWIPAVIGSIHSSSLQLLDFSQNKFTGGFAARVQGSPLSALRVLSFAHNEIEGSIPPWFGNLKSLRVLDLSFNKLTGSIPQNFGDLDGYKVQYSDGDYGYKSQISDVSRFKGAAFIANQRLNKTFAGDTVSYSYSLVVTTFMDLSSNALRGKIPVGLAGLIGMTYLNLSNNNLDGNLWAAVQNLTALTALETLDVSQNNLGGQLPPALPSTLSKFLVFLNNFVGSIPQEIPYYGFPSNYYLPGNPGLCGNVIQRPCAGENETHSLRFQNFRASDYISFAGFGIGAFAGFGIVAMTALLWEPARIFVFGAEEKRRAAAKVQPAAYGLFRPRN